MRTTLLTALDEQVSTAKQLLSGLDEQQLNQVPFQGSWTAAQVVRHITKSTNGISAAMEKPSRPIDRAEDEKAAYLKTIFLDMTTKMQSPEFIIPEEIHYQKPEILTELEQTFSRFSEVASTAALNQLVEGLPFGDVSKCELLHFVLYHTQRHVQQLTHICDRIK